MVSVSRRGFTLIELLVVIAIIAILSVVVILTLNPAELLRQSRDSDRVSDMSTLKTALGVFAAQNGGSFGSSSVVYVSIPDPLATSSAGDQCQGLGLPSPGADTYQCASPSTYKKVDGTGWIPVNFNSVSTGAPISKLPVDPVNTSSTSEYYTYTTNGSTYEITTALESQKYASLETADGGEYSDLYEQGSNLALAPIDFGPSRFGYVQSASVCNNSSAGDTKSFSSNVAGGDLIIDAYKSEANVAPTPTDTLGTPFTLKASMTSGSSNFLWVFSGIAPASGADTVANTVASPNWPCTSIMEVIGPAGTVNTSASVYGGSVTSTVNVTTTVSRTFVYAAIGGYHNPDTFTPVTGFTDPSSANSNGSDAIGAEYAVESTIGGYTPGFGIGGSGFDNAPLVSVVFQ